MLLRRVFNGLYFIGGLLVAVRRSIQFGSELSISLDVNTVKITEWQLSKRLEEGY